MNRGGHTNLSGAPVDSFVPIIDHKLNNPDSERTLIEAMEVALNNPAFEKRWGDLLRAKHPALAKAHENMKAGNRLNGRTPGVMDAAVSGEIIGHPAANAPKAAMTASRKTRTVSMDGNFVPKGFEQTPFDNAGLAVAQGEQQRATDPRTVAGMAGDTNIDGLMTKLAGTMDAIFAGIRARGGIPRTGVSVQRRGVTVKGIRAADSAATAKAKLKQAMDAAEAQAKATGAEMAPIPTRWDARLGQYVLAD
ncbi:hypothetical protein IAG25_25435 [Caballeronia sp. EK]|uniref:hypothetical protein n=1 Tax=Caballeronia sp. EK TaxID=2767469 RepID=UPI001655967E|nr:hypothetical protein [Caballeronia sp. EK]MBC8640178.1 hypothetical protein [Caballeronia sp. EK]